MATKTKAPRLEWPQRSRPSRDHVREWRSKNAGRSYRITRHTWPGMPLAFYACYLTAAGQWATCDDGPPKRYRTFNAAKRSCARHFAGKGAANA